jgi:hypothetical protein
MPMRLILPASGEPHARDEYAGLCRIAIHHNSLRRPRQRALELDILRQLYDASALRMDRHCRHAQAQSKT